MADYLNTKKERFQAWWQKPVTKSYRVSSGLLGLWAGIWIGGLGRVFYQTPVSFNVIGYFALFGAIAGAIIGSSFPKGSRFISLPFAFMGVSCSGT